MEIPSLNRKQRRKLDKKVKNKLTDEQYKKYMSKTHCEAIEIEVNRRLENTWENIEEFLKIAMKENRVSEERRDKIFARVLELAKEKFPEEEACNERLF